MSDELYSNVLNDIVAILNEDTALSRDKKIHEIMRAFIMGLCGDPGISMLDNIFAVGIAQNVFKPNIANTSWMIISALLGFTISSIENQLHLTDNFNQLVDDFVQILLGGILQ